MALASSKPEVEVAVAYVAVSLFKMNDKAMVVLSISSLLNAQPLLLCLLTCVRTWDGKSVYLVVKGGSFLHQRALFPIIKSGVVII